MTARGNPTRVVVLGPLPPPYGGPETMTAALVAALTTRDDLDVRHINTEVSKSLAEKNGQHQLRKSFAGALQALTLMRLLITFRPEVVYLPLTNSPSFLGFLRDATFILPARLCGRRIAIRLHGGYYFYVHMSGVRRRIVRAVLGLVDLAMVQGERLKSAFNGMIASERIVVIPNGVDDQPFAEARCRASSPPSSEPRILFVGLLCAEKGLWEMLASIPLIPRGHFVLVGEWRSPAVEQQAREFVASRGIQDRVTFAGVVVGTEKYDLFVSSDILMFPTMFVYEGHAVVTVEALAAGLPIVCTDHGALNESVQDGWNGYFIPKADANALAMRLNELIDNTTLRKTMATRSRLRFEERFRIEAFVARWIDSILGLA